MSGGREQQRILTATDFSREGFGCGVCGHWNGRQTHKLSMPCDQSAAVWHPLLCFAAEGIYSAIQEVITVSGE